MDRDRVHRIRLRVHAPPLARLIEAMSFALQPTFCSGATLKPAPSVASLIHRPAHVFHLTYDDIRA